MKIAFYTPDINCRGTCVALFDYAYYSQQYFNFTPIIISHSSYLSSNDIVITKKFQLHFPLFYISNIDELESILEKEKCNLLYCIKYGKNDGIYSKRIPTVIHCVFDMSEPHGDVYAGVSETLAKKFNKELYVPHMVSLPISIFKESLRQTLNISKDDIVYGRYGGMDTFDIPFVYETIKEVVQVKKNIYFLFINTPKFITHPQVIYLDKVYDNDEKNRFICTCDFMIHARLGGETFGLAIAEFSINNKPIITYGGYVVDTAHKEILKEKAIYYHNKDDLYNLFLTLDSDKVKDKDWNCYKEYRPLKVMEQFKKVFCNILNK